MEKVNKGNFPCVYKSQKNCMAVEYLIQAAVENIGLDNI